MEKIRMIELLILAIGVAATFSTYLLLLLIDVIVHQRLYQYGLQFSPNWANPYWMYLRISLTLLLVVTIAIVVLTGIIRLQKTKLKTGIEEFTQLRKKLRGAELFISVIGLASAFSTCALLLSIDKIIHETLYQYGLRFSYDWANFYWTCMRASFTLLGVMAAAITSLTVIIRRQRIEPFTVIIRRERIKPLMEIEKKPVRLPKIEVEEELFRLREKLWRVRGRRSRATGVAFLVVSGVFLSLAYFTRYIVFEITSILALLLGVVFVFIGVESYVKMSVASRAVTSSLIPLSRVLSHLKVDGKAIHIPATSERGSSKIFIRANSRSSLPSFEEITKRDDVMILSKGVLLPSVGDDLLQLYEEELGDLRSIDLGYLMEWLPKVLVDGLRIAERMEMAQKGMEIHVKLTASAFRQVCQQTEATKVICETTGCPICSSIADAIAKTTGQIVYYVNCSYDPATRETSAQYRLGPSIKSLMKKEKEEKGSAKQRLTP